MILMQPIASSSTTSCTQNHQQQQQQTRGWLRIRGCRNNELFVFLIAMQAIVIAVSFCCSKHKIAYSDLLLALSSSKTNHGFTPMPEDAKVGLPNVRFGCGDASAAQGEYHQHHLPPMQIHIIAWRRPLEPLLQQLQQADYTDTTTAATAAAHNSGSNSNISIPLYIHLDGGSAASTIATAQSVSWPHGPVTTHIRDGPNVGLRTMWLTAIGEAARTAPTDDTLLIVLEDDVRVAPAYMQWLRAVVRQYAAQPGCRDRDLVGFSLSPLKVQEMSKPFQRWDAQEALGMRNNNLYRHLAYGATVPSSWGAAYFADRWREFDAFVQVRMQAPYYNVTEELRTDIVDYSAYRLTPPVLQLPHNARCNVWPKSWKRFLVDFMYARGMIMVYPNWPGELGFATALQTDGEHVGSGAVTTNPRVAALVPQTPLDFAATGHLPRYGDLAMFDLFLLPTSKLALAEEGIKFVRNIHHMCPSCGDLLQKWAPPHQKKYWQASPQRSKSSVPSCWADLYTSVAAQRPLHQQQQQQSEKFLLFEPQYGANNQLHALVEAYFWAKALHRRLVVPPLFLPRVSEANSTLDGVPFDQFFTLKDYRSTKASFDASALTPISYEEFLKKNVQPWRMIRVTRSAIFDGSARLLAPNVPTVSLRPLLEESISVKRLQDSLGGCDDTVLAFDGLYYAGIKGVDVRGVMPDVLHPTAAVERLYRAVQQQLHRELGSQQYACLHVRMGDFVDMCATLTSSNSTSTVPPSYLRTFAEFSCVLSPEDVKRYLKLSGMPAFVMSDSPDKLQLEGYKAVSSDWTERAIRAQNDAIASSPREIQILSLLMDQRLCADASYAYLNRFSTVSQRVLSLRRRKDFEYFKPLLVKGE